MTAVDHETGKKIINPYIQISKSSKEGCYFLNTSTFEDCQEELIHPLDRQIDELEKENKLYVVEAVVGEYNGSPNPGISSLLKTVSITRHERSRTLLGYLEEKVVRKELPQTFAALNPKSNSPKS